VKALGCCMRGPNAQVWAVLDGGLFPMKLEEGQPIGIRFDNLDSISHRPDRIFVEDSGGTKYYLSKQGHKRLLKQLDEVESRSSK